MKLKFLVLAATLALSGPAFAAPVTSTEKSTTDKTLQGPEANFLGTTWIPVSGDGDRKQYTTSFSLLTSGVYSFWMAGASDATGNGVFSATLKDALGGVVKKIAFELDGLTPYYAQYWTDLNLSAGNYTLNVKGTSFGDGSSAAAAGLRNDTVAVPGPEAGAGLGALAMGGIALYMKRRRKGENLA